VTPREVVQAAFRFEETPVVPYLITAEDEIKQRLDEYYAPEDWLGRLEPFIALGMWGLKFTEGNDAQSRDPFGSIVDMGNIMHVTRPVLSEPTLAGYRWPTIDELDDWEKMDEFFADKQDSYRMAGFPMGLFERAWQMRGMENFLVDLIRNPDFANELLDGIMQLHIDVMDFIVNRVSIDAYFGGDDWSDQRGPIMGLERWREFFKPRLARIIDHCHSLGYKYITHSCGNVLPLVDDLMEIGMDGLESLQLEAMDVYELKRKTAGKMVLIGGMGTQSTLPFGTADEVRAETKKLLAELGKGGGYILCPAKPMLADTPIENAVAFIETAMHKG